VHSADAVLLAIDRLVELRWLHPSRRDDPVAVCEGFRRFIGLGST